MMRRLRLNFYRAEDAFLIMKKREWAQEDIEFAKQQKERKQKSLNKRLVQNRQRRLRKEQVKTNRIILEYQLIYLNVKHILEGTENEC